MEATDGEYVSCCGLCLSRMLCTWKKAEMKHELTRGEVGQVSTICNEVDRDMQCVQYCYSMSGVMILDLPPSISTSLNVSQLLILISTKLSGE